MRGMSIGYPVHAVASWSTWTNKHGAAFTDWEAACGQTGTTAGVVGVFGNVLSARKRELCPACWPAGHHTFHPEPTYHGDRDPATHLHGESEVAA